MKNLSDLQKKDLEHIFHPCSQMKDYEKLPPMVIVKGDGLYVEDEFGNRYMDCVSSWWVNLFGHCNPRINNAIKSQIDKLEHIIFANFSHEAAIELGEKLTAVAPKGLNKLIFTDNGSSSTEVAIKLSFQYHAQTGNPQKKSFVSIEGAYHGETIGALGVGNMDRFTDIYKPLLREGVKVKGPDCFNCSFKKKRESCNAECFIYMEEYLLKNSEIISGVIIESMVQGVAGMKIYSPIYLKKLRTLTKKLNIHLIADEIATGFGRTGRMFAIEHAGVSPDIMCIGKGLTAGYFPMSIVMITDKLYNAFYADYSEGKSFLHSHSYSGNPIGCRIAVETLKIFEEENILEIVKEKGEYLEKVAKEKLKHAPYLGEYRQIGLIGAIELVDVPGVRAGYEIYKIALKKGAILRPLGNIIYFMPPYIIKREEIDRMLDIFNESLKEYLETI
ncbi:adenosylmethionine--8-amino-7-oxononanoate transaminase [Candidatus Cetobacterium colombiensis]|uniref:Adenosylmethionine-8-amino-7-oxononanoate aminotransferase n=1 Tax=Candidatus Cetobacterium colombiensis TaxID=3073100 RepID=A0ABU4WB72_9FUSO|nr:adenosylmethionine--8-amino-7-oxononanoate transaminase [Candidatus Cetobacterium colombiensis]MDX8336779.1 adenosylmethionine--8-amino-7-oxononanoate transaminase [Candidatus Cetobacterium colombiensis]